MAPKKKIQTTDYTDFMDNASLAYISPNKPIEAPVKEVKVAETRSKRLQLLIEPKKSAQLKIIANNKNISVNELVNQYITAGLKAELE